MSDVRVARRHSPSRALLPALVAAALALTLAPAQALMPPFVYENARNEAKSVIVLAVEGVAITARQFGTCTVSGTVKVVERGSAFTVGQKVELVVPCTKPDAGPPLSGIIYQPVALLQSAKFGRAYLDAEGKVALSQYYPLDALP